MRTRTARPYPVNMYDISDIAQALVLNSVHSSRRWRLVQLLDNDLRDVTP